MFFLPDRFLTEKSLHVFKYLQQQTWVWQMTLNKVIALPMFIAPSLSTNPEEEISLCVSLTRK